MTKMKDSGIEWIGEIPEEWRVKRLKLITSIERGSSPRPIDKYLADEEGIHWIRIGDAEKNNKYINSTKLKITKLGANLSKYIVPGTLILSNSMSFGQPYIVSIFGCIHDGWLSIRPNRNTYKEYLYWVLLSDVCVSQFKLSSIGAVVENLSVDKVGNAEIPFPSLSEQTKIVDYLDKKVAQLDKVKTLLEEQIASLQEYRQSLIYETVTKGLDKTIPMKYSGVDWIGQIPEGWKVKRLKYVFETIGSGTTPDSSKSDYYDGDINWLQSGDLYKADYVEKVSKTITELGYRNSASLKIYQAPFIALAMYGASIGNLAISKIDACVNQAVVVLKDDEQLVRFTKYALECSKEELIFAAQGGTQPNINQVLIKNWQIPLPSATELKEIADFLDTKTAQINQMIAIKQEQIDNINQQRQTLIYDVVTGKRRV